MADDCTIYNVSEFIGKRWILVIILELFKTKNERKRYNQIKKAIPDITPKILSLRLKELEREGLITKEIDISETSIKTFYALTESGLDFIEIILSIKKWGIKWNKSGKECHKTQCKYCHLECNVK